MAFTVSAYLPTPMVRLMGPHPPPAVDAPGLTPGARFSGWIGHWHVYRPQPNPGADAFAYDALGLTEFSPIGPADINRGGIYPFEAHSTLFAGLALPTSGLGGLVSGQFIGQPLLVPDELSAPAGQDPGDPIAAYGGM